MILKMKRCRRKRNHEKRLTKKKERKIRRMTGTEKGKNKKRVDEV
jgi:hypothetical protein